MKTDIYTPAIPFDELVALARKYGPSGLAGPDEPRLSPDKARRLVQSMSCPCIRGETCICAAVANEFLRLAHQFRRQHNENNPTANRPGTERWENEGGSSLAKTAGTRAESDSR